MRKLEIYETGLGWFIRSSTPIKLCQAFKANELLKIIMEYIKDRGEDAALVVSKTPVGELEIELAEVFDL